MAWMYRTMDASRMAETGQPSSQGPCELVVSNPGLLIINRANIVAMLLVLQHEAKHFVRARFHPAFRNLGAEMGMVWGKGLCGKHAESSPGIPLAHRPVRIGRTHVPTAVAGVEGVCRWMDREPSSLASRGEVAK